MREAVRRLAFLARVYLKIVMYVVKEQPMSSKSKVEPERKVEPSEEVDVAAGLVTAATGPDVLLDDEPRIRFTAHVRNRLTSPDGSDANDWSDLTVEDLLFCLRDIVADVGAFSSIGLQRLGDLDVRDAVELERVLWDAIRAAAVSFASFEDALTALVVSEVVSEGAE